MSADIFCGNLVHLEILEPERDSVVLHQWAHDSEYLRLLDSDPAFSWPPKMMKEFFEKNFDQMHAFLIRALADNRPIGMCDLNDISIGDLNCWVGIGIGERAFWGQGYGTDAMRVILRYAFNVLNLHRVTLDVFDYNQRALRSYEKCGFKVEGRERQWLKRDGKYHDLIFMGILQEEWRKYQQELGVEAE